jgi:hypothetical protein
MVTVTGTLLVGCTSAGSEVRSSGATTRSRVMVWSPRTAPTTAPAVRTTPAARNATRRAVTTR